MPRTPSRTVRISDRLWNAAQAEARARGEPLSRPIVRALIDYISNTKQKDTTA